MAKKLLHVGVIGVGGIAGTHMPGWEASEHAEVVAGADLRQEALDAWGKAFGVAKLVTDPDKLIEDADIDIVDICTPNRYHADLAIAAMERGKHVICEKPLAPTPEEIRRMIAARDRAGVLLMTAQHLRFGDAARAAKAEIDTGCLGRVYHARCWILRRAALPVRPGFILREHSGGGPCIDIGVHVLDLALHMMGFPEPVAVSGVARKELAGQPGAWSIWGGAVPPEMDVEDFAAAFVRFADGATLILEVSWMLHHPGEGGGDFQMWLYGRAGGLHYPSCTFLSTNNETRQHYDRQLRYFEKGPKPHAAECIEFARAVAEGDGSPVPAEQSLIVQAILDGLYRSQAAGAEVKIAL